MNAISTRYIGATTRLPARILATDQDGNRITLSAYDTGDEQFPYDRAHRAAAEALCRKMDLPGAETLIGGSVKNGQVWVFPPTRSAADDALAVIVALMDGQEWHADTLDAIADACRRAGFTIRDTSEVSS